jgi:branched-chain amino acid transport system permease protein
VSATTAMQQPPTTDDAGAESVARTTRTVRDVLAAERRGARWQALGWLVLAGAGLGAPWMIGLYELQLAVQGATMGVLALSIGWLLRQTGQLSFGHAMFYGTAGYATAYVGTHGDLPLYAVLACGLLCGTVLAFAVALVTVRAPGIAFAMLTLAIGMMAWVAGGQLRSITHGFDGLNVALEGTLLGDPVGSYINPVTSWPLVWLTLMTAVGGLWWLSRTPWGRRLAAIRENEERTRFSGYGTFLPRVVAFTVSGFVASLAGTLSVVTTSFISLESLYWSTSGLALIVAVIGGTRSVLGPPAGAVVFVLLQNYLTEVGDHYQLVLGLTLIVVVLVCPGGAAELAVKATSVVRRIPTTRKGARDAAAH